MQAWGSRSLISVTCFYMQYFNLASEEDSDTYMLMEAQRKPCTCVTLMHDLQILLQALPCRVATLLQKGRQLDHRVA